MSIDTWIYMAAGLTIFLALGHTVGAVLAKPTHGADEVALREAMRAMRFKEMGITRSYWDAYFGSGWTITVLLLGTAAMMWFMVPVARDNPAAARPLLWTLSLCYLGVTAISSRYFVTAPIVVSGAITFTLAAAAYIAGTA